MMREPRGSVRFNTKTTTENSGAAYLASPERPVVSTSVQVGPVAMHPTLKNQVESIVNRVSKIGLMRRIDKTLQSLANLLCRKNQQCVVPHAPCLQTARQVCNGVVQGADISAEECPARAICRIDVKITKCIRRVNWFVNVLKGCIQKERLVRIVLLDLVSNYS